MHSPALLVKAMAKAPVIKICGITRADDAEAAIDAGAQIIGLMFVPGSRRLVTPEQARPLCDFIRGRALIAGIFMDQPHHEVEAITKTLDLDVLQLHGSEYCRDWLRLGRPLIKRFLPHQFSPATLLAGVTPLLDPGAGDGRTHPWQDHEGDYSNALIAGGLTADNVKEAILTARPLGVDVSSGVESGHGGPGMKDPDKIAAFVQSVKASYCELAQRQAAAVL